MNEGDPEAPAPSTDAAAAPMSLEWLSPGYRPSPAEALQRIQLICKAQPDLHNAMLTVLVTHQGVPREVMALALKQFRPDLGPYSRDDVQNLLVSIWNGGKSGFDAVLRTRAAAPKRAGGLSWVKD
jgi:hypothetical protein